MGTILLIIFALIVGFVILGLLGWGVQLLGFATEFLGNGIWGCLGCIGRFIWVIIVIIVVLALIL